MITLGIESSCDETGAGLVDGEFRVLGQCVYSQAASHARFGGVVPEVAARAHLEKIAPVVEAVMTEAKIQAEEIDVIAYTRGPGLLGPLLVGSTFAQGMAKALGKPAMGLSHLEGHLASAYLSHPKLEPPFLLLLVSGGHTELVKVEKGLVIKVLGRTRDDAAGEAFDKCGKILGLDYPAGPEVARLAQTGRRDFLRFPRAMLEPGSLEFSFSGLKTAVLREAQKRGVEEVSKLRNDFCASLEAAIVEVLREKAESALQQSGESRLVLAGGVAANLSLRRELTHSARQQGFELILPETRYCGDNGVMMAAAAQKRLQWGIWPESGGVSASLTWN